MTSPRSIFQGIGYLLFFSVLIVSSYLYIKKEARERERATLALSCEASGGDVTSTAPYCVCPPIFPVLDEGQKFCRDRFGARVSSREEFELVMVRYDFANTCRSRGDEVYVLGGTSLTMCYNQAWGSPVVTKEKGIDIYRMSFVTSTARGKTETLVWWYGKGEALPSISGFSPKCFSCLTTSTPEAELITQLGLRGTGRLIAGTLGDYTAFKVTSNANGRSLLVVPNVLNDWYLAVSVPNAQVKEAEVAIKEIWFDEHIY